MAKEVKGKKPAGSKPVDGKAASTPFYEAFDKKGRPVSKRKSTHARPDDYFEFENDYYEPKKIRKVVSGAERSKGADAPKPVGSAKASGLAKSEGYAKPSGTSKVGAASGQKSSNTKKDAPRYEGRRKDAVDPAYRMFQVEPPCSIAHSCGGCQLQNISYEGQLKIKQNKLQQMLGGFGKLSPIIGMEKPINYRNKVHATFSYDKTGKVIVGIYEEDSHRVIPITDCMIQDVRANAIIQTVKKLMPSFKMKPYEEDYDTGFMRHLLIRTGHVSGEVMVVIVGGNPIFPSKNNFVKALVKEHPSITTVVFNLNNRRTSMVLGEKESILYGKGYIEDTLCGKTFRISPKSFYQVNAIQTEILYNKAMEMANFSGNEVLLDAYCGIGTIGIIASSRVKQVVGVELNKDAVRDAIINAKLNGVDNANFYQGDAGEVMVEMAAEGEKLDVVILDPPRSGSDENFLGALLKIAPPKVVYVSCNPETLARDLKVLTSNGYKVKEMVGVDMFPYTNHVEAVVLMTRSDSGENK